MFKAQVSYLPLSISITEIWKAETIDDCSPSLLKIAYTCLHWQSKMLHFSIKTQKYPKLNESLASIKLKEINYIINYIIYNLIIQLILAWFRTAVYKWKQNNGPTAQKKTDVKILPTTACNPTTNQLSSRIRPVLEVALSGKFMLNKPIKISSLLCFNLVSSWCFG